MLCFLHGAIGIEITLFIFDTAQEPLDKDVISSGAFIIHTDENLFILQRFRKVFDVY